ncbi:MAG: STAS domain-containing protein [Planctomycetota bacterium]|jgi:anti-sigma B factor antagonist
MKFYYSDVENDILIVNADGGLNADNADQFIDELGRLIEAGQTKIIVDCSHLDYISSYGLGVLVRLHSKLAKRGGDVKLACVKSVIEKVLTMTRLNTVFEIYPDVSRATLMFRPKDDN